MPLMESARRATPANYAIALTVGLPPPSKPSGIAYQSPAPSHWIPMESQSWERF